VVSSVRTQGGLALLAPDAARLREFWEALVLPGDVHEVRVPRTRRGPARLWGVASGYFDGPGAFVAALSDLTGADAEGVYLTLNPVEPALLARAANRLVCGKPPTTADRDVIRLRHLLVDADSVRPAGISATTEELRGALGRRDAVRRFLREELGWPHPLAVTESGNGGGLVYRLDLPNDAESAALIARVLAALSALFSSADVKIDTTTANSARITKVIGSVAAKGDHLAERPWRLATGRVHPAAKSVLVRSLADAAALATAPEPGRRLAPTGRDWDVRDLLRGHGIAYAEKPQPWATVLRLDRCLTSLDHSDGAAVLEFPSGALAYRCHHDRCAGKGWAEAREALGLTPRPDRVPSAPHTATGGRSATGTVFDPLAGPRLLITPLSAVEPRDVAWLWPRWLARGKVHLCGGHPGDGKSTLLAALAATLSRGGAWPDGAPAPVGNALFLLAEDGVDDTLRPRLDLHGADVGRVFALQAVADPDGRHRVFSLERHLDLLREAVAERAVDLVVIDPVTSFMPKADRNAEGDVRDILTPLSQFADEAGVAVVGIMHVGKPTGSPRRPLQQLLGATAFGAVARVVWMVAELPAEARGDDDDPDAPTPRLLGVIKSNLAVRPAALEWVRPLDGPVTWRGESAHDLGEVLGGGKPAPLEEAKAFLAEALKGGSKSSVGLKQAAKADGISFGTLRRAADLLGVERVKQPGVANGPWLWKLPDGQPRTAGGDRGGDDGDETKARNAKDAQVSAFASSTHRGEGSATAGEGGGAPSEPGRSEGAQLSALGGEHLRDGAVQETLL